MHRERSGIIAFQRDRLTWTIYILLGYFAFMQSLQGPIMPTLRSELQISYTVGSLHLSANAFGMVLIGLFGDTIIKRIGIRAALWGGLLGMTLGAFGLILGRHVAITIASTAFMGITASLFLITQQMVLGQHHGSQRAIAFSEANIAASLCALLAPLSVGVLLSAGLGWRPALLLPLPLFAVLFLRESREPLPELEAQESSAAQRLPLHFWGFWAVACLGVAAEWSLGFWGSDYLHSVVGMQLERAVTTLSVFFIAMLLGRVVGSRMVRRHTPMQILAGALLLALFGVILLWQARQPALSILGMACAGLGIGNLFPMSLAAAAETAPQQMALVSTRMSLAGGLAILAAPLILGSQADKIGLQPAFGFVPLQMILALLFLGALRFVRDEG